MNFGEKLQLLTHVYKISNSKLARGINVDASLISRWKTGDRAISAQSPHLAALATFFVQTNAYPYQKVYLSRLLQSLKGNQPELSMDDAERIHLLANWLAMADDVDMPQFPDLPVALADPVKLLDNISSWFSKTSQQKQPRMTARLPAAAASLWQKAVVPGEKQPCEVFFGLNGKRQAVVNILLEALASPESCDIYLVSEEHMSWLTDDPHFTRYLAGLLQQIIERGNKITVIHVVSRRTQEIFGILEFWMPLHLSGQIRSYYNPKYIDPFIQHSLFIVKNRAVCFAQSTDDLKTQVLSFVCHDREIVSHYARLYTSSLANCLPLLNVYNAQKRFAFQEDLRSLQEQFTRIFFIRCQLNPFLLPAQLFAGLLQERNSPEEAGKSHEAEWLLACRERFMQKIENGCDVYDMIPLSLLDELCQNDLMISGNCELLIHRTIKLSLADMADWLEQITITLRLQKSYHIYLYQEDSTADHAPFSMAYYENQAALFAPAASWDPFIIMLREANTMHSLGLFLDRFIARIPTCQRNRDDVMRRLDQAVQRLRQKTGIVHSDDDSSLIQDSRQNSR